MDAILDWLAEELAPLSPYRIAARMRADITAWCDIRATSPLAVLAGLNCVAGLIVMKSQEVGSTFRLSDARMCLAAVAATGLAIASRWALSQCQRQQPSFWIKTLLAAFSVLPLAALFVVATPRNSLLAVAFVSGLAVLAGNANLLWKKKPATPAVEPIAVRGPSRSALTLIERVAAAPVLDVIDEGVSPATVQPRSIQIGNPVSGKISLHERPRSAEWCERSTDSAGNAVMQGTIRACFSAGQSLATAHIPFLPPFDRTPEFLCKAIDAPAIRVRTPAVFRYGARLELKRTGDISQPASIPVEYHVVAREPACRAA